MSEVRKIMAFAVDKVSFQLLHFIFPFLPSCFISSISFTFTMGPRMISKVACCLLLFVCGWPGIGWKLFHLCMSCRSCCCFVIAPLRLLKYLFSLTLSFSFMFFSERFLTLDLFITQVLAGFLVVLEVLVREHTQTQTCI